MSRYLCMNCWQVSEPDDLWLHCPRCTAPMRSVGPEDWLVDPNEESSAAESRGMRRVGDRGGSWIRELIGGSEPVARCDVHPRDPVSLHCSCGLKVLPRAYLQQSKPLVLGFAGPRSSGKTLMTLAMIRELRQKEITGRQLGLIGLGDTETRFGRLQNRVLDKGEKPGATDPEVPGVDDGLEPSPLDSTVTANSFCWQLNLDGAGHRHPMLLGVYDLAGETWGAGLDERLDRFDRYLRLLASLVFVVDGAALASDLGLPAADAWDRHPNRERDAGVDDLQWMARILDRLGAHVKNVNLALVVSKADLIWGDPKWQGLKLAEGEEPLSEEHQDLLRELLTAGGRRDLLVPSFRAVRAFAASSLGFRPENDDVRDDRLIRGIEPTGLLAPLEWLLTESWPALRSS